MMSMVSRSPSVKHVAIGPDGLPYVVYLSVEGEYVTYTTHVYQLPGTLVHMSNAGRGRPHF